MKIEISSLGILQDYLSAAGKEVQFEEYEKLKVREILQILKRRWGKDFYEQVIEGENIKKQIVILLNGLSIAMKSGLETEVKDGDRLTFAVFISGG